MAKKTQLKEDKQPQIQEERQQFMKPNRPQKPRGSWVRNW
jgi:conjugal transfer/entry exclusion protein